ncbi:unnamed protein product [Ranitomeya imitator]|uniref:DED domain-containing protein n=1 Tax=Ranitomeya imitator TaxID=111125 RepID=A0ABN9LCY4_9NEOB|nr:unnamed protein product [Ranitomeya imitator]
MQQQLLDGNQGKHRVTKRGPALSYPMFTLVTSEDIAESEFVCIVLKCQLKLDLLKLFATMAAARKSVFCHSWEEEECLEYYGMLSLHRVFDAIGSQLTDSDIEALSFLLNESYPFTHPLDPNIWTAEEAGEVPGGALLAAWQRWNRHSNASNNADSDTSHLRRPKNGTELLLELERRGRCDESNFKHILQLLRVLTRHDLIPYVSLKRPRTVSPERCTYGPSIVDSDKQMDGCLNSTTSQTREESWETGSNAKKRKRVGKINRRRCTNQNKSKVSSSAPPAAETTQSKVTCGKCGHVSLSPFSPSISPESICNEEPPPH